MKNLILVNHIKFDLLKILVLGCSGLIGRAILEKSSKFFDVIGTYNKNTIEISGIKLISIKLPQHIDQLCSLIRSEKPDIVIDTIANSNPEFCELNKEQTYKLHVESFNEICSVCSKTNSKLIFISSDYVFDGKKGNYSENDETSPLNYYGVTKVLAEKNVLKYSKNVIIRTSLVYGWNPKAKFLNFVLDNLREEKTISVYDNIFSPTLLDELTEAIIKIISSNVSGIFHVVGSSCVSKFYFAKLIAKKFKMNEELIKSLSIHDSNLKIQIPKNTCLDNTKIKNTFGITFSTIEEGLAKVYFQSQLTKSN